MKLFKIAVMAFTSSVLASCAPGHIENEVVVSSDKNVRSCEISYSMLPHEKAINKLGQKRLTALDDVRVTFDGERQFIESFDAMTQEIINVASKGDVRFLAGESQTVFGGYGGFTSPSLSVVFEVNTQNERRVIDAIAGALGYVYLQDSVLVQCDALEGDDVVISYNMTEMGVVDAINPKTLKSIYGMMIGQANGNLDLGFSYYESEDRFSVLGLDKNGKKFTALNGVEETIEAFTQNRGQIQIAEVPKWVGFPSNDWSRYPEGRAYIEGAQLGEVLEDLNALQRRFIVDIDERLGR